MGNRMDGVCRRGWHWVEESLAIHPTHEMESGNEKDSLCET